VVRAHRRGEAHRRCREVETSAELKHVLSGVNSILDAAATRPHAPPPGRATEAERAALMRLLEQQPGPTVLLDARGDIAAANLAGIQRLGEEDGAALRQRLARIPLEGKAAVDRGWPAPEPLSGTGAWLCRLPAEGGPPEAR
jgi:hypothetical protein